MRSRVAVVALLAFGLLATANAWNPRSLLGYGGGCGECEETKPCGKHQDDSSCVIVVDGKIPKVRMGTDKCTVATECPVECKEDTNIKIVTPCDIVPECDEGCHAKKVPDQHQNIWGGGKLYAEDCEEITEHVEKYVNGVLCSQTGVPEEDKKNCLESASCNKCQEEKPCEEHKAPCEEECKPKKQECEEECKPKKQPKKQPKKPSPKPCPPSPKPCPPAPKASPKPAPCDSPKPPVKECEPCVKVWAEPERCYGDVVLAEECDKKCAPSPKPCKQECHDECHNECEEVKPCQKPCQDEEETCKDISIVVVGQQPPKPTTKPPSCNDQQCGEWTVAGCKKP